MEGLAVLNIVEAMILTAQDIMVQMADVGWRLGATIATASLLFGLAIRVAAGGGGVVPAVVAWIITTGLVLGALSFWPLLMQESFNTANEVSALFGGGGITALDVIARGYGLFARVFEAGVQGAIWNPVNYLMYFLMLIQALFILLIHTFLSLIVAASILQFWIGGAALPIIIPFALISGLQGLGFQAFVFVAAAVLRLIVISIIITVGQDAVLDIIVPDAGGVLTLIDLVAAGLAGLVVLYLAWQASSWATTIARGAAGGTGITGLVTTAVTAGAVRGSRANRISNN